MNIQAQVSGIVLMLILLYYFLQRKKLMLHADRAFLRTLLITITCVTLDAASIVAIAHLDTWIYGIVLSVCKAYLCSLLFVGLCAFLYSLDEVYSRSTSRHFRISMLYKCIAVAGCIAIILLPTYIHTGKSATDVYTYGSSVIATYVFAVFLVISNFYLIFRKKGQMNPHRREAILFWMLLWMLASLIQFFNNQLLLVGYASALGMMILYLKLENPETYINRNTGIFNRLYLQTYLAQLFDRQESRSILDIILLPSAKHSPENALAPETIKEIGLYLNSLPHVLSFEYTENEIILIAQSHLGIAETLDQIQERFSRGWGKQGIIRVGAHYTVIPDICMAKSAEELMSILRYLRKYTHEYMDGEICTVDEAMLAAFHEEQQMEAFMVSAIENDRLEVFFQPIYSIRDTSFTSAEALVRIRTEDGEIIAPNRFIPLAESNGMILQIGEIVFEKVCVFLKEHSPEKLGIHYIEVNLSVVQCGYEFLAEKYIGIMKKHGIHPDWINLEITESASLAAKKTLLENMRRLIDYGVHFSLDDFGTGQSNLNYIIDMPVDIVKFDKNMTRAYFENGKAKFVMDAAMQMIRGLQLTIVSEGIEQREQYETMKALGIEYIQGYYFSKPLTMADYLLFLRSRNRISQQAD